MPLFGGGSEVRWRARTLWLVCRLLCIQFAKLAALFATQWNMESSRCKPGAAVLCQVVQVVAVLASGHVWRIFFSLGSFAMFDCGPRAAVDRGLRVISAFCT